MIAQHVPGFLARIVLLLVLGVVVPSVAHADEVTDAYGVRSSHDAWSYFRLSPAQHDFDTTYVPTRADIQAAQFQGFVRVPDGIFGPFYDGSEEDSVFVFSTIVRSNRPMTLPLSLTGDDGHSLFVNHVRVATGGFDVAANYDLQLRPGRPVLLDVAGYNGPDGWVFGLRNPDLQSIMMVPGIHIQACRPTGPPQLRC